MPTQKISFLKGLDKDSDIRFLENAYRDAFNVRITDYQSGNKLVITNVKGNTEKEYTLRSGYNFVIGSYDDKINKNVYYFVYNSNSKHSILRYDYKNDEVSKILELAGLGFTFENKITGVALLDNRYLIFTDNNQEPMKVDLNNTAQYEVFNPQDQQDTLTLARKPQVLPILAVYQNNASKQYNNLQGNLWQFRCVVVYDDDTKSDFGSISRLTTPSIDNQSNFSANVDISQDNEILLSVPVPTFYSNNSHIKGIELYARGVNADNQKTDNWYLFHEEDILTMELRISRLGSEYADYTFANDGIFVLADVLDASQEQTYVPKKAKALSLIHGNRLALANTTEGFDTIDVEATVQFNTNAVPSIPSASASPTYNNSNKPEGFAEVSNPTFGIEINDSVSASGLSVNPSYDTISLGKSTSANFSPYDRITFTLRLTYYVYMGTASGATLLSTHTRDIDFSYLITDEVTNGAVVNGIYNTINAVDTTLAVSGGNIGGIVCANGRIYQGQSLTSVDNPASFVSAYGITADTKVALLGSFTVTNLRQIQTKPTFKKDAIHEFGIQYSDGKGRRSTVLTNANLRKYAPTQTGNTSTAGRITADINVSSTPPEWAKYWSVMYTKNQSYDYYIQFLGDATVNSGFVTIDLTTSTTTDPFANFRAENANSSIEYTFQKGDVIKVLFRNDGVNISSEEFEILNGENGAIKFKTGSLTNGSRYTFEIRRPKKEISEKLFYEIGHAYKVYNPIGFGTGLSTDDNALLSSITTNTTTGVDGTYNVPLNTVSGSGSGASAAVTISGGALTAIDIASNNVGSGYALGDILSITGADIGSATDVLFFLARGHQGGLQTGDQDQTPSQPAIVQLNDVGDSYYIHRPYYVNDYGMTAGIIAQMAEHTSFSDYYRSDVTSIGRANIANSESKEINRTTAVVYSQPYIPESNVNGISTFYGSSIEQYSTQYGSIQYIYAEGKRLFLFQENKIGQIGINEQFFLNGTQQTYQTTQVLNEAQYYPAEYGIGQCPESFSCFGYRKYFVDTLRGAVIRLSQDGLTPISHVGLRGEFNTILKTNNPYNFRMTYNEQFDELTFAAIPKIISSGFIVIGTTPVQISLNKSQLPNLAVGDKCTVYYNTGSTQEFTVASFVEGLTTYNIILDGVLAGATINLLQFGNYNVITFNEEAGAWISKFDYKPDWLEECGIGMVSFKNGKIYLHDNSNTRGNFYGTSYPAKVTVVANENPSYPKLFKTIQQESTRQWECPSITTLESQSSNLIDDDFQKIQNQWYAAFLFDENTPNVTDPLLNGDPLRSSAMEIQMQNDTTSEEKMFSVGVNYIISNLSNDE